MFSENTGFYFFSSLLQAQAAIFSIIGVFVVFKIQINKSAIENCKQLLINSHSHTSCIVNFEESNQVIRKKEYIKEGKGSVQLLYQRWDELESEISGIKHGVKRPIIGLIASMMINTVGIIFTKVIHANVIIEIITLGVVTIIFGFILIDVYLSTSKMLK